MGGAGVEPTPRYFKYQMIARMFSRGRPIAAWVSVTRIGRSIRIGFLIIIASHSWRRRVSVVDSPSSWNLFS